MRYGATKAAVEELEKVRPWLCVTSELGGDVMLELGLAYIANKQDEEAKECFRKLLKNPTREKKRIAQQMLFQEEAQSFMKTANSEPAGAEFAKIARSGLERSRRVGVESRYAPVYDAKIKRVPVKSLA